MINRTVFILGEACVTLYPANASGGANTSSPIWLGAQTEGLRCREVWNRKQTRPTGGLYPVNHPLIPEYEITMDRVWAFEIAAAAALNGLETEDMNGNFVLDILWTDQDNGNWYRKTFYGVTIAERNLNSRTIDSGFTDDVAVQAQYYVSSGGSSTPPALSASVPYLVYWTGTDGQRVLLYTYDPEAMVFTAQSSTSGRATVSYVGGNFTIQFSGESSPTVQAISSAGLAYQNGNNYQNPNPYDSGFQGLIVAGGIHDAASLPTDLPRLDFYYGGQRICTVTTTGLYESQFVETATPETNQACFQLFAGATLIGTFAGTEVDAVGLVEV